MAPHNGSLIEVRDLRKVYQMGRTAVNALAGVSLDVPEGAFRAVMGPSGSGKSTLLNLIGGLDRANAGALRVAGQEITSLDENGLALYRQQMCGFIFQSFNLVGSMTALQNVEFPMVFRARCAAGTPAAGALSAGGRGPGRPYGP